MNNGDMIKNNFSAQILCQNNYHLIAVDVKLEKFATISKGDRLMTYLIEICLCLHYQC